MLKLFLTSVAVALIYFSQADSSSGLELGAVNVFSRNVTSWKNITKEVSIDTFTYTYCSLGKQCRKKSGTRHESQHFIIATVETELYCRPGFYQTGKSCEDDCVETKKAYRVCSPELDQCCQNGGTCLNTNYNITCNCSDGWIGDYCSERCPVNFYGPRCSLECPACSNGGTCDPVKGQCDCSPGWTGPTCDEKCSTGWYGKDCALDCKSCTLDGGQCHHITGECECALPFGGLFCGDICHDGDNVQCGWFPDCCRNGATCDQTGSESRCKCPPGYLGKFCETRCTGLWGDGCHRRCLCNNNATCDPTTGECECTPGSSGKYCQESLKPAIGSLKCPVNCSKDYGCDQDGHCLCPSNSTWSEDTLSCLRIAENIQTSAITKRPDNFGKTSQLFYIFCFYLLPSTYYYLT
ncbi:multiple epidermal growth factor-like domains protein 10 [Anneissia japonica]|uniref:multiple epidermal growth factor-like domains protein 10 n=1 Tax=Anneissia japonica TaxID=1529436 RepID=UPI00142580C7|nr:multiple epidermal growth factor-like domains protein 10 [Anneissia japonica]